MANKKKKKNNSQVMYQSKQLPEAQTDTSLATISKKSSSSKKTETEVKNAQFEKELEEIHISNKQISDTVANFSSDLRGLLATDRTIIPEHETDINIKRTGMNFELYGDTNKNQKLQSVINKMLEEDTKRITGHMHTGVYGRIELARKCDFIENGLPILGQSARLFIDDVINGSYRGFNFSESQQFTFYENGVEIKDTKKINKMLNILNPKEYSMLSKDVTPFNVLQTMGIGGAWKHGYKLIRSLPNKKIAQDLYIKYCMKTEKAKRMQGKIKVNTVAKLIDEKAELGAAERFEQTETGSWIVNDDYRAQEYFSRRNTVFNIQPEYICEGKEISAFEAREAGFYGESFYDFVVRMVNNIVHPIYTTSRKTYSIEKKDLIYTLESGGYTSAMLDNLIAELIDIDLDVYNMPSFEAFGTGMLDLYTFDDIYQMNIYTSPNISSVYNAIGTECFSDFEKGYIPAMEGITYDSDMKPVFESPALDNVTGEPVLPDTGAGSSKIGDQINLAGRDPATGAKRSAEELLKTDNVRYGRIDKTFASITGEVSEELDNTRCVPLIVGSKLLGAIYIEFTHQDVEHYIGLRHIINNPTGYMTEIDTLNIKYEEQEETIGRLIFSDTIKPIIDKHISVKFLKNNQDILGTIYKLLKENEVSNSISINDVNKTAVYNMSRVIFIPVEELTFFRNGTTYLGSSQFEKAITPAAAVILAQEKYLAYQLVDAAGYTFVSVNKGLSENTGEEGLGPLFAQIDEMRMTRLKLRDMSFSNSDLSHKFIYYEKPESLTAPLDIQHIEPGEFHIDPEIITRWIQEATEITGYNSALFSSQDNANVELARKLSEMDDNKKLIVDEVRRNMIPPSSALATKLLRVRGGEAYANIVAIWTPPPLERKNVTTRTEKLKEIAESLTEYVNIAESIFESREEWAYTKEDFIRELIAEMKVDDPIVNAMEDILKRAKQKAEIAAASNMDEKATKSKKEDEGDDK